MASIRHPLSEALYDYDPSIGEVVVSLGDAEGRFTPEGRWLGGTLRIADPELCRWVSSPRLVSRRRSLPQEEGAR